MALVATRTNPESGKREIIGVGRLSQEVFDNKAEFALLISDQFQGQGLGSELLRRLLQVAREEGLETVEAYMLPDNRGMKRIVENLGFSLEREEDLVKATIDL